MKNCKCNKLNPNFPPDISGEFEGLTEWYGNLNGHVIPLEKPLKFNSTISFEQNELFVKMILFSERFPERENAPGAWRKKIRSKFKF